MEHVKKIGNKLYKPEIMEVLSKRLGINAADIVYERVFGEEKDVQVNGKEYTLLPIGNRNEYVQTMLDNPNHRNRGNNSLSGAERILTSKLVPIKYDADVDPIRDSYISHYKETLGEVWSNEDFNARISSLSYLTFKYAVDKETGRIFIVGFFGVQVATGAGGKYLTNGELYVLPEFRGMGIATELVHQTLGLAHEDGIENFDSLTYSVPGNDSLSFWKNIGADSTELYHIAGSVSEMLDGTSQKK